MRIRTLLTSALLVAAPLAAMAAEPVDLQVVTRIRDEGFNHSQVMETARVLTDEIGPRVTNSPAMRHAADWTREKLASWGLVDAHLEPFEFGRGWSFDDVHVRMLAPQTTPLIAYPKAWSPGTDGTVSGPAVRATLESEDDLEKLRGTLGGKILLLDEAETLEPPEEPLFKRLDADRLEEIVEFPIPEGDRPDWRRRYLKRMQFAPKLNAFLAEEGVLATVEISSRGGGIVRLAGNRAYEVGEDPGPPAVVLAAEHYNRVARLLEHGDEVTLEIAVSARFHEADTKAHTVVAEIPGTDLGAQVVMLGAHLDSWHAGTGATDDAAGCAVVMEAVRILQAIGVKPRRTIRVALWSSEEQGLNGSRAYVAEHFASRAEPDDPAQKKLPYWARSEKKPLEVKPEHAKLAAYFNIDNGGGKLRGIYAQENAAVKPIFEAWLAPFADLGADTVTLRRTGGTDHLSFDAVGLPGFQFIQDPLDYMTRTHHTDLDVFDRLQEADLKQAAVIMASFVYHAAMRGEMLPRKPMPKDEPTGDDN